MKIFSEIKIRMKFPPQWLNEIGLNRHKILVFTYRLGKQFFLFSSDENETKLHEKSIQIEVNKKLEYRMHTHKKIRGLSICLIHFMCKSSEPKLSFIESSRWKTNKKVCFRERAEVKHLSVDVVARNHNHLSQVILIFSICCT